MKKPFHGDGMAISQLLYGQHDVQNVATPSDKNNCTGKCPGPVSAIKDARNMARAMQSLQGDSNTSQHIFDELKSKYCSSCADKMKRKFWKEMEGANGKVE